MTRPILSATTAFAPATLDKVERLLEVLEALHGDPVLGPAFVLHGGTALNVFLPPVSPSTSTSCTWMTSQTSRRCGGTLAHLLAPLSRPTPDEAEYLRLLDHEAYYRPELLFEPWPDVLERARLDPVTKWKVGNLAKRLAR